MAGTHNPRGIVAAIAISGLMLVSIVGTALSEPQGCRIARRPIGGHAADIRHWPGVASLRLRHLDRQESLHFCGGTVIAPRWVLTAAHCLDDLEGIWHGIVSRADDFSRVRLEIILGTDNLDSISEANVYSTETRIQNETYAKAYAQAKAGPDPSQAHRTAELHGHDIALVKLSRPWNGPISPLPSPLAQAPDASLPEGETLLVAGFGSTDPYAQDLRKLTRANGEQYFASTPELLEVALPLVNSANCKTHWPAAAIGSGQLCAGFARGRGRDSCNGDSGGPIVMLDQDLCPRQIGLVSWGAYPCASERGAYGVYTRVSEFSKWLKTNIPELRY